MSEAVIDSNAEMQLDIGETCEDDPVTSKAKQAGPGRPLRCLPVRGTSTFGR